MTSLFPNKVACKTDFSISIASAATLENMAVCDEI